MNFIPIWKNGAHFINHRLSILLMAILKSWIINFSFRFKVLPVYFELFLFSILICRPNRSQISSRTPFQNRMSLNCVFFRDLNSENINSFWEISFFCFLIGFCDFWEFKWLIHLILALYNLSFRYLLLKNQGIIICSTFRATRHRTVFTKIWN